MVLNLDKKVEVDTIQIDGKKYPFIQLRPAANYDANKILEEIKNREVTTQEEEDKLLDDIHEYLSLIIDAPRDVLDGFGFNHFIELLKYFEIKPLLDQGFTERKIQELNKKAMERVIDGSVEIPQ